jgi:XTP/dITP diphosphohydrolase
MKFVLASHNKNKLREMQEILGALGVEVVLQSELGLDLEPEENGETFAENALIKARAVMEESGLPAIADDSGLCVDALQGAPGVYSARYGGEGLTDQQRYELVLRGVAGQFPRTCRFQCAIACCFPEGAVLTAEGKCEGTVAFTPMGEGGFGYDPIFFVPGLKKTFAQLNAEEKNAISHRGKALSTFAEKLKTYLQENVSP